MCIINVTVVVVVLLLIIFLFISTKLVGVNNKQSVNGCNGDSSSSSLLLLINYTIKIMY